MEDSMKKSLKRKRATPISENVSGEEKECRIDGLRREIDRLFQYFKEVSIQKVHLEENGSCSSSNSRIALLLEESDLPFSKLVEVIYEKLQMIEGITLASVRSTVLLIGQRSMYGIANADADVLEDNTDKCLWCWETRDLKLMPRTKRGVLNIRRICRKKIHERITAVSAMIAALQMQPDGHPNYKFSLMKASEKLAKVLNEKEIRLLVENMLQKNVTDMAEKEAKLKEKVLIKDLERNKREVEKEKKRMDREHQKEKLQNEKELKRQQEEAEKEERRREKEEAEIKKQLKRQQEDAEKDQRRREKEEAELKKQLSIKKQATIMERFLKTKKNNSSSITYNQSSKEQMASDSAVTLAMDCALSHKDDIDMDALRRSHLDVWNKLGRSIRCDKSKHWGLRQKPKTVLIKELKLQGSSSESDPLGKVTAANEVVDGWEEAVPDDKLCHKTSDGLVNNIRIRNGTRKLLQFDKSHRPAYYGTMSTKSDVIAPRHPFKKDPNLDYDIESDEEWEEEDPGESLSDCDKDEEEETLEEGNLRTEDEDGSEDGFLVPDGYLSENEGVQVDSMEADAVDDDDARSSPTSKQDLESDEFRTLLRQQKYIHNLTEHALQKNQPLIISNFMYEKATLLIAEGLNGTPKVEQIFLQALSIRLFPGGVPIEISIDHMTQDEDQEVCHSQNKGSTTPGTPATLILDKDLPKIVSSIQSCSHGINKVIESLQRNFPTVSKSQLRNKVREISDFVDNRWQVKKDVLEKLGLSISPEKCGGKPKGIVAFFSKRCLPPAANGPIKIGETSPEPCRKPEMLRTEQCCTENSLL